MAQASNCPATKAWAAGLAFQTGVAIYGGFFGAGMGVMPSLPMLLLLACLPALAVTALLAAPSQPGPNRFGPDPLDVLA